MLTSFIAGFTLGFSLILAIGAQNAFVLKQGLRGEHVFAICLFCACSDALLIIMGIVGFNAVIQQFPWLEPLMRYGGAVFLFAYGARSFWSVIKSDQGLNPADAPTQSLKKVLLICLAFTWLNPHVYLDTVGLIGSISTQYPDKYAFAFGATSASFLFFFSLGYGAALLRPVLAKPKAWKILDFGIGLVMWVIAMSLLIN